MKVSQVEKIFFYETKIGKIAIVSIGDAVTRIDFVNPTRKNIPSGLEVTETPVIKEAHRQLEQYLNGKRREFSIKLLPRGTEFQMKVWDALTKIPFGKTASYMEIAAAIGNPKSCRAVGGANNKNPISIIIPCHRVIGANGKLVGYGGGLDIKEKLLHLEGVL